MKNIFKLLFCLAAGTTLAVQVASAQEIKPADMLAKYYSPATEQPASPDKDGFIRRWTMLEPIKIDVSANRIFSDNYVRTLVDSTFFEGEETIMPKDGQKVKVGKDKLKWHAFDSQIFYANLFRFAEGLERDTYGNAFFVVTTVNCEEDIENVRLSSGANSSAVWFLNGEEVLLMANDRDLIVDDMMSKRLTLKKGENVIRGMVFNGPGMATFCLRFVDESGNPVKNYTITSKLK